MPWANYFTAWNFSFLISKMEMIITALSCLSYNIAVRSKSDVRSQYVKTFCISCPYYDKQNWTLILSFQLIHSSAVFTTAYHSLHKTPLFSVGSHDIFIPLVFYLPLLYLVIRFWGFLRPTFNHHYRFLSHFCPFTRHSCNEFILTPLFSPTVSKLIGLLQNLL